MAKIRLLNNSPPTEWLDPQTQLDHALSNVEKAHMHDEVDLVRGNHYSFFQNPERDYTYEGVIYPPRLENFMDHAHHGQAALDIAVEKYVDASPLADVPAGQQSHNITRNISRSAVVATKILTYSHEGDDLKSGDFMDLWRKKAENLRVQAEKDGVEDTYEKKVWHPEILFVFKSKDDHVMITTSSRGFKKK